MDILIIGHFGLYENTPRSFRTIELAKELVRRNHKVDIIEGKNKKIIENFTLDYKNEECESSTVVVKEKKLKWLRKIVSTILNYLCGDMVILKFYNSTLNLIDKNKKYDVILSIGQPFYTHMVSAFGLKNMKCVKIADCGDPFYVDSKRQAPYLGYLQKLVFKRLDYVAIPTNIAVKYYDKYVEKEKIKVIPQGVDFSAFDVQEYKKKEVISFGYAGIFYETLRDPRVFFDYLKKVDTDYKFYLYTDIENDFYKKLLKPMLEELGDKVEIHGLITRNECLYIMSGMDFLVNFENLSSVQAPSKLIDYGISKRPVLSFSSETFDENTFLEFLDGNYEKQLKFDISQFDIKKVTDQFECLMKGN